MASQTLKIVQGNNKFGTEVFKVTARNEGNVLISPFSAHVVLSMAYHGACNETEISMRKTLGLPEGELAASGYHDIISRTSKITSVILNVANKIYLMEGFKLNTNFKNIIERKYLAEAEEVNFQDNVKSAALINDWVKEKTKEKITNLIDARMLNADTKLVLLNAVYFKGSWAKKFNKDNTKKEPFYLLSGDEVIVDMMHVEGKFRYQENEQFNCKILELPYEGNELSMLVFLPNERNGISQLQDKISVMDIGKINRQLDLLTVNVALPKFKIESTIPLNSVLAEIGLDIIFSNKANFCKIAEKGEQLVVSDVIQKTFIEVNEEGAEAAAATAGIIRKKRSISTPQRKYFIADQPFLYSIITMNDGNVLFFGRTSQFHIENKISHDEF